MTEKETQVFIDFAEKTANNAEATGKVLQLLADKIQGLEDDIQDLKRSA